eukprot:COSAG02_NODE_17615_length_991_cov_1.147982_1_plen_78_part_00
MSYTRMSSCIRVDADGEFTVSFVDVVADELLDTLVDADVSIADVGSDRLALQESRATGDSSNSEYTPSFRVLVSQSG